MSLAARPLGIEPPGAAPTRRIPPSCARGVTLTRREKGEPVSQLSLFSADLTPPQLSDLGGLLAAHGQIVAGPDGFRLSILLADQWRAEALLRECRVRDVAAEVLAGPAVSAAGAAGASGAAGAAGEPVPDDPDPGGPIPDAHLPDAPAPARRPPDATPADSQPPDGPAPFAAGDRVRAATVFRSQRTSVLADLAANWTRGAVKAVPVGLTLTPGFLRCWTIAAGQPAAVGFLLGLDPHAPDTYEPLAAVCAAAGLAGSLLGIRGGGPAVRIVGYRRCARLAEMIGTPPPEAPRGAFPALSH